MNLIVNLLFISVCLKSGKSLLGVTLYRRLAQLQKLVSVQGLFTACCFVQHVKKGALNDILLNDCKDYAKLVAAMKQMDIDQDGMMAIFEVVAGVLHLGNIIFEDAGGSSGVLMNLLFLV